MDSQHTPRIHALVLGIEEYYPIFFEVQRAFTPYARQRYRQPAAFTHDITFFTAQAWGYARSRHYDIAFLDSALDREVLPHRLLSEAIREQDPMMPIVGMSMMGTFLSHDPLARSTYDITTPANITPHRLCDILEQTHLLPGR